MDRLPNSRDRLANIDWSRWYNRDITYRSGINERDKHFVVHKVDIK